MQSSRNAALNILFEVFENNQFSNKLLNKLKQKSLFKEQDVNFIYKLVYGTIQYKIYLEYVVNKLIDPKKTNKKIQILLWMNFYQIKFLNNPIYSVTNESVEITKKIDKSLSGLVNVVTKKLENQDLWEVDIKNKKNIAPLKNGFPYWLFEKISKDFSSEIALKVVESSNNTNEISFRINTKKISIKEFKDKFLNKLDCKKSTIANNCYVSKSNSFLFELVNDGFIYIQDETSVRAVELLEVKPESKILDMCCAPGGKLSFLAALVESNNFIDGYEINSSKKNIIKQNLKVLDINNVNLYFKDARLVKEHYDCILLDAPCSGYGLIKKKPEIKLKKYSDLEMQKMYQVQKELLMTAIDNLNDGGTILYSTCTINKNENQDLINEVIKKTKMKLILEEQYFGFEGNNNGFYIAKLKKEF
ncbi:16S rRNA (cytosine967-C5)-methyltransferase [Spiroplasma helicoides]|uniref:16S rRNA (Cytosine967-C5)-methyltransferase n=1 Tax=Spiroplasma helicoides TaxID=216938 RepID=A0A1B3SLD7_9MOLU|nr:transcription antitermination factor NusB [Spiroplasma helicoides]AOG60730.1 16S rRNA (cytosine967-C5)-methyltransferase [Spiroplasma helicoides]